MDEGKEQHRQAVAVGRAAELIAGEQTAPDWGRLMKAVGEVGLARATVEQLTEWSDSLDRLGAPYLASAIRRERDERKPPSAAPAPSCSHGMELRQCIVKCDGCGHDCGEHIPGVGCVHLEDDESGEQCSCDRFED
jgi:hypothetical protein